MTAHRRWEEKPDPLVIEVSIPETGINGGTRVLPEIKVTLKNVDSGNEPIRLFVTGENTHFKHRGWRIHVWDSSGQRIPVRWDDRLMGGSTGSTELHIQQGEKHEASLAMDAYVDIPNPGRYTCQIIYSNANDIADIKCESELDELIVFQSSKFDVEIEQGPFIEISLTKDVATQARELVSELQGKNVALILDEEYTEQCHSFIDPEFPAGKLLTLNWKAVPALLECLENKDLDVHKRALIFGLLYSISRDRHLFPPGNVLGFYQQRVAGGFVGGFGLRNAEKQKAFAEKWLKFRDDYIRVSYAGE